VEIVKALQLSFVSGIGNVTIKKILERFGSFENVFELSFEELSQFIGTKTANLILNSKDLEKRAVEEYKRAKKEGVRLVPLTDKNYPNNLKNISDPPSILYVKGIFPINEKAVSIVGTRKVSSYGRYTSEKFSKELSEDGINIVSGLATGVDTIAHKSAIETGGFTTAVLGSGIDIVFPIENKKLYEKLYMQGCIISEFPIGTKPTKYTFPQRNRIIAGLSYATVVTEASKKSGALITAKYANDYGRLVFAVPSNINNINAQGSNLLLKEGAFPLTETQDIYTQIPYLKPEKHSKLKEELPLNEIERQILQLLNEPTHIDLLVEKTDLNISQLSTILFDLEFKGLIKNDNGIYIRLV